MTRILVVSVGGSPEPILKAVELHQPDEVVFACSAPPCQAPSLEQVTGAGTPCRHVVNGQDEWRPNLVTQLNLKGFRPDLQLIPLPDPDDLIDCLARLRQFIAGLSDRFSQIELCGDFTGGTKSMSAALAITLLDYNTELSVVSGPRNNLVRVQHSEGLRVVQAAPLMARRLLRERLPPLLEAHFYDRARGLLRDFQLDHGTRLSEQLQLSLDVLLGQLQALVLWDRFRWQEALSIAEQYGLRQSWPELHAWWQRVEASIDWQPHQPPSVAITGYELVQDLLLNAERRGRRGWFDDAVARLYRASELLAQTYVTLELGIDGPVDWTSRTLTLQTGEQIPTTGVTALYRWLQNYEAPRGLGGIYGRQWRELMRLFDSRNKSLLGHGLRPIMAAEWQALQDRVTNLLHDVLAELQIQQGPLPCQLPGRAWLDQPLVQDLLELRP